MTTTGPAAPYVLGGTDAEHERLIRQAARLDLSGGSDHVSGSGFREKQRARGDSNTRPTGSKPVALVQLSYGRVRAP